MNLERGSAYVTSEDVGCGTDMPGSDDSAGCFPATKEFLMSYEAWGKFIEIVERDGGLIAIATWGE